MGLHEIIRTLSSYGRVRKEKTMDKAEDNMEKISKLPVKEKPKKPKTPSWPLTEAAKLKKGVPGYVNVSDLYGHAVKVKVDNVNVSAHDLDVSKLNLKGTLRITGRVPAEWNEERNPRRN